MLNPRQFVDRLIDKLASKLHEKMEANRKEREGISRLLRAIATMPTLEDELSIPLAHPNSIAYSLVEQDPAKWN